MQGVDNKENLAKLGRANLYFFARGILGYDWMVPHVHLGLCNFLQSYHPRKSVVLPRGFLKTTVCSTAYPIWRAVNDPNVRFLIVQNKADNARKIIQAIRMIFEKNQLFREVYPEIIPNFRKVRWSDSAAEVRRDAGHPEATFEPAGIASAVTSRHYDVIIEDDIISAEKDDMTGIEAIPSRESVEKAIGWHKLATSLLANPKDGEILNVGTRWAKFDVVEHILTEQADYYKFFHMSALDENGAPVYPERFDMETLNRIKADQGTYIFSTQYLNSPIDEDSMVFLPDWIKFYEREPEGLTNYIIVDPAISEKRKADFSCVMCVGMDGTGSIYVLEYVRKKINPSQLIDEIFKMASRRMPVARVIIETVAYQKALAHFFEKEKIVRGVPLRVEEVTPGRGESKDLRIRSLQPIAELGRLFIKPHHTELYKEIIDFPYGATDDIIDALAYATRYVRLPQKQKATNSQIRTYTMEDMIRELHNRGKSQHLPFKRQLA